MLVPEAHRKYVFALGIKDVTDLVPIALGSLVANLDEYIYEAKDRTGDRLMCDIDQVTMVLLDAPNTD